MRSTPLIAAALAAGLVLATFGLAPVSPVVASDPPLFISVLDDLPLMPGLVEDTESGMVFDTARGRIVEAFAQGEVRRDKVVAFYDETLPQLGWQRVAPGTFRREGEILHLEFSDKAAPTANQAAGSSEILTVSFRLMPSGG